MALFTGHIPRRDRGYEVPFAIRANAYVVALLVVHLLAPRVAPVRV